MEQSKAVVPDNKRDWVMEGLPPETRLIDLLYGYSHPFTLTQLSDAQVREKVKTELEPYQLHDRIIFKKNDGTYYEIAENRNDCYWSVVDDYLKRNTQSALVNDFLVELLTNSNVIDKWALFELERRLCEPKSKNRGICLGEEDITQFFNEIFRAITGKYKISEFPEDQAKPGLKELIEDERFDIGWLQKRRLLATLQKIQDDFESIKQELIQQARKADKENFKIDPSFIAQKLNRMDFSAIKKIREFVAKKLENKAIHDLLEDDRIRLGKKNRSQPNMNEHKHEYLQERLQTIVGMANAKKATEAIREDAYGVTTVNLTLDDARDNVTEKALVEGRQLKGDKDARKKRSRVRAEVRYYRSGAYERTKRENFEEKIQLWADVASGINPAAQERIRQIKEEYLSKVRREINLNATKANDVPVDYKTTLAAAGDLLWEYQAKLVTVAYPPNDKDVMTKIKDFKKDVQQYLIDNGRPIIVHVFPDQKKISAQFPKGKTTYPSDYRTAKEPGINPNGVLDVVAYTQNDGRLKVASVGSRAVSVSVFGINDDAERHRLNVANLKQDILDRLVLEHRKLIPGQILEISSISLLTPLNWLGETAGKAKRGYESETRQLIDHHRALMELDGQEITVNGIPVTLSITHVNFSVKDPGTAEANPLIVNDKLMDKLNSTGLDDKKKKSQKSEKKGFEKYKEKQRETLTPDSMQERYFKEICEEYEGKTYKDSSHEAFLFAAKYERSEELRGALVMWNCKSTRDRSEHLACYRTALIDLENEGLTLNDAEGEDLFNQKLLENQDYGAGRRANAMSGSGFAANRVNDPSKQRDDKLDSLTSNLSKAKYSEKSVLKLLADLAEGNADIERLDTILEDKLPDGEFKTVVKLSQGIKVPFLRAALVNALMSRTEADKKEITPAAFKEAVERINGLFPDRLFKQGEFENKIQEFAGVVSDTFGLAGLEGVFFAALITHQKTRKSDLVKELEKNRPLIPKYINYLDTAIELMSKVSRVKALVLRKLKNEIQTLTPELTFGKSELNEKPTHVYLLDKSNRFVKYDYAELIADQYGAEEDFKIAVEKQHVIYESPNQLKYEPPIGTKFGGDENAANNDILWQVIQQAMKTLKVTDYTKLEFEGTLKEKALAEIERRKAMATSSATKLHEREKIAMSLKDAKRVDAAATAPTV